MPEHPPPIITVTSKNAISVHKIQNTCILTPSSDIVNQWRNEPKILRGQNLTHGAQFLNSGERAKKFDFLK